MTIPADAPFPASMFLDEFGHIWPNVLDLGLDHYAKGYKRYGGTDAVVGFNMLHPKGASPIDAYSGSPWCMGSITLSVPEAEGLSGPRWELHSLDPLHVEPSLLCNCGDHGFIRHGKWVPA